MNSIGGLITAVGRTQALLPQIQAIASTSIPDLAGARASSARILDVLRDDATSAAERGGTAQPELDVVVPGGSHVTLISHPHDVAALIETAATAH